MGPAPSRCEWAGCPNHTASAEPTPIPAIGTSFPLWLYRVPGIRSLQDATYQWVAAHRYRFPGTTPYRESHPVAC